MLPPVKRGELMSKRLLVVPAFLLALLVVFAVASAQAAPGDLDTSFGAGGKVVTDFGAGGDYAAAVAIQPNGKIVAGGDAQIGTTAAFGLARYNANGSIDTSFGSGGLVATTFGTGNTRVNGIALQPDGKIVTAGFDKNATEFEFALARYNADGSLDTSFGSGGRVTTAISDRYDLAFAMTLQPDGKIVVVGETRGSTATKYDAAVVRYTPAGALDTTFGSGGKVTTA